MKRTVEFHHGALADPYEFQANKQGYTLGDKRQYVQDVAFGLIAAYINGCITDKEYDRILQRFQKKILIANLKPLKDGDKNDTDG